MANPQSARWLITVNNPGAWIPHFDDAEMLYMVFQSEMGHEEGTPHIHCYVVFRNRKRRNTVKRLMDFEGDIRVPDGSERANRDYCTKLDTRSEGPNGEFGTYEPTRGVQGKRSDLELICSRLREGQSMLQATNDHPGDYVRYHQGLEGYRRLIQPTPPMMREVRVWVLWGPTGTGKTHRCVHHWPGAFMVEPGRDIWGGYDNQETIIFDDFKDTAWDISVMKRILDKWRYPLDRRYHNGWAAWTNVIITTNTPPLSWYPNEAQVDVNAIRRRLADGCRLVTTRYEPLIEDIFLQPPNPNFFII